MIQSTLILQKKTLSVRMETMMVLILELFSCSLHCLTLPLLEVIKIISKLLNVLGVMVEYCSMNPFLLASQ